jgi:peptide deformylase
MALREILKYPDRRLKQPGEPVAEITDEIRELLDDMALTMYAAPGVGLAATQIGVPLRIFVLDLTSGDEPSALRVFVNPEIVEHRGEIVWDEGCLSFPGIREDIERAAWIKVKALDRDGKPFEMEGEGLFAVAVQHEIDHLDGVLLVDRVSFIRRRLIHRAMMKRIRDREMPEPAEAGAL